MCSLLPIMEITIRTTVVDHCKCLSTNNCCDFLHIASLKVKQKKLCKYIITI